MTALAGVWHFDGRPDAANCCARMLAAQELYGPDDSAQWSEGDVAVGRQLMRVLPEDNRDHQPLIGGGGRFRLVADVRLDNRDELIDRLGVPAAQARTLSDASILLTAFERWEESCFEHLIGDYAFAVWDSVQTRLLLARDPLGQRPLHYHYGNKFIAFASMPKGLHALPEVPYAPDEERIAEFLALIPEGPKSFFLGIERVEPGHFVTVTATGVKSRRYWNPAKRRITLKSPEDYSDAVRELLDKAVRCRLRGAGDIGVFLSGGLDSGAVAATAARLLEGSGKRVIAMTGVPRRGYDYSDPPNCIGDEGPYAAAIAALYPNIEHVLCRNEGYSPLENLDRDFYLYEKPNRGIEYTGWSNSFTEVVRQYNLRVTLSGHLGNLGFSYNGLELLPELFRRGRWLKFYREARTLVENRRMRWRGVLANTLGPWCPPSLWLWINKVAHRSAVEVADYSAVNPRRLSELDLPGRARARKLDLLYRPWKDGFDMRVWALQNTDPGNSNKGALGRWHVDQRDPTADLRLIEFCLAVPTEQFLCNGMPRALARRALADRLPRTVLDERRRGLQVADWHIDLTAARDTIRGELARLQDCPAANRALDLPRLHRLVENWPSAGWERDEIIMRYRYALLRAISTGHFLRRATASNR
jgi:asparagine synthase (glutamine-hydrolysing)